jgi:hypothetical protein
MRGLNWAVLQEGASKSDEIGSSSGQLRKRSQRGQC